MSFVSVVPKPVYTMVDLEKKRKDRVKAKYQPSPVGSTAGSDKDTKQEEAELCSTSDCKDVSSTHKYEDVDINEVKPPLHPATTTEEASTTGAARPAKSSYTMISAETLLSPDVTRYEDTNITSDDSKNAPKKGSNSFHKIQCAAIFLSISLLFIGMCGGFAFTTFKILEMKSQLQLDSTSNNSDISRLMQTISELQLMQTISELQLMQTISELRANLSVLSDQYCTVTDCRAIDRTLSSSLRELDEWHQQLAQTLEHLGLPFSPAPSCAALLAFSPTTPSGYYWVRAGNGYAVRVYCDMTRSCGGVTGGWMRVASLNTSNTGTQCPGNFSMMYTTNIQLCGIEIVSSMTGRSRCSSTTFSLSGMLYSRVCGHVRAYQLGSPEAFHSGKTVNDVYVDGLSLTHGSPQRRHIWSWAAASSNTSLCPCDRTNPPLPFVGQDYFCDTASQESSRDFSDFSNPLWDGEDCVSGNSCCSFNNPPWFHKQLPEPTTDDMEMRVCADELQANEDIGIESFEIYVHQTN